MEEFELKKDGGEVDDFHIGTTDKWYQTFEGRQLVESLLANELGDKASLVSRYLDGPPAKRNTMPVFNTARATIRFVMMCLYPCIQYFVFRYQVSPAAGAAIASQFLKDLINAGYLPPEMVFLACDPSKLVRARKKVMTAAKGDNSEKGSRQIEAISYDGRKDRNTKAMIWDPAIGKEKLCKVTEEHESVVEEPTGRYIGHFKPDPPIHPEKPALKVAQGLLKLLEENNSTQSLQVLGGDSTNMNTGWRGGSHANLEELLGRRLFWAICNLHTNELPLRHLITTLDGPTSSKEGFTGPVCSLLTKVGDMKYNPSFKALPSGEDLVKLPLDVVNKMSTDQKRCYELVVAVKNGEGVWSQPYSEAEG